MKSILKKPLLNTESPLNENDPIRLAFLGGARCGKTCLISKLAYGNFRETYYPLRQTQPILFDFVADEPTLRMMLDDSRPKQSLGMALAREDIVLSPVVYNSLVSNTTKRGQPGSSQEQDGLRVRLSNGYYFTYFDKHCRSSDVAPNVSPILMELIDTPAFNPIQTVPFLEASLYIKLDEGTLHNLAREPRRPVSTNPLLVASGASELNGSVDGYFFCYSAVPSMMPPPYDGGEEANIGVAQPRFPDGAPPPGPDETSYSLLPVMKAALDDAWQEYYTYKTRWEQGKETDVFSFKTALRGMLQEDQRRPSTDRNVPEQSHPQLLDISTDPSDPSCSPPIWIICTNRDLPLASPRLVQDGKNLARLWRCGFIALDVRDNVEDVLALMVRELVERRKLRKASKKKA